MSENEQKQLTRVNNYFCGVEKQEDIAHKQYKKDQEQEKLPKAIEAIGLWTNQTQVDNGLDKIRNKTEKLN